METSAFEQLFTGVVAARGFRTTKGIVPPLSGTWTAGTTLTDSGGQQWLCVVGGTPGTWAPYPNTAAGLVNPTDIERITGVTTISTLNQIKARRVIVPQTGVLHDLSVFIGTASGNLVGLVFDTGDANSGSRTLLWNSGSVAASGTNAWQTLGNPGLAVKAGQQLDLAFAADNTIVSLGTYTTQAGTYTLPTNFQPAAGGASPKRVWVNTPASFATITGWAVGQTLAEASVTAPGNGIVYPVIARVANT